MAVFWLLASGPVASAGGGPLLCGVAVLTRQRQEADWEVGVSELPLAP